ncbi:MULTISPECIES: hypothetical protein [Salinivibrio]|uniref:Uncharacterized protein n=2 Tax=Salinivibrio TaxID=51366 RepID=A0ABY7LJ40_9GAMM|nr:MULTISPECIES: hypothetical protein [Salinivibrio]QIR07528.1 hypothetical protein HBA18_14000 [Salinivibrio costicola]WBA16222.1 hypothetical protein N7E60_15850 [Salinivibrio proteolyticus]
MTTVTANMPRTRRSYAVTIKGLIAHAMDVLFTSNTNAHAYDASRLPAHLQRDIGINR